MKYPVITILLFTLFIMSCQTQTTEENATETSLANELSPAEKEAKAQRDEETFNTECSSVSIFLTHTLSIFPVYNESQKFKVDGVQLKFDFFNAATITAFGDVKMKVKFIGKGGRTVKEEIYPIPEIIKPNGPTYCTLDAKMTNQQYNAFEDTEISLVESTCLIDSKIAAEINQNEN